MPTCSYNLQYAEFDHDQVDERGTATARDILEAFDQFGWAGQVEIANRLQKCSPTLSVSDLDSDRLFWVSGFGTPSAIRFVNDYTYQGEIRRFFGLSRHERPVSVRTRELSLDEARQGLELFVNGGHEELLRLLAAQADAARLPSNTPLQRTCLRGAEMGRGRIA